MYVFLCNIEKERSLCFSEFSGQSWFEFPNVMFLYISRFVGAATCCHIREWRIGTTLPSALLIWAVAIRIIIILIFIIGILIVSMIGIINGTTLASEWLCWSGQWPRARSSYWHNRCSSIHNSLWGIQPFCSLRLSVLTLSWNIYDKVATGPESWV